MGIMCFASVTIMAQGKQKKFHLPPTAQYVKGTLIMKIKPEYKSYMRAEGLDLPSFRRAQQKLNITQALRPYPDHAPTARVNNLTGEPLVDMSTIYFVDYRADVEVEEAINLLWTEDAYEFIEPRYIQTPFLTPNDPTLTTNLNAYTLGDIQAFGAYDYVTGSANVVAGWVDTGYWNGRPDMDANIKYNTAEINGNGIDDDANGYVDDYAGWDFFQNDGNPNVGANTHGFATARIYGANTNNALQGAGVSFNCAFRNIRAGSNTEIMYGYEGIAYAADNGCHVINCSWGSDYYSAYGETVVNYATINKNCAVIVACGNSASDIRYYPAAYRRAISVAVLVGAGIVSSPSTYNYTVDLATPGWGTFTSNAAPVVTSAVALTYRRFHDILGDASFTPYRAAQRVRAMATNIDGLNAAQYQNKLGNGLLNMLKSVNDALLTPSMRITTDVLSITSGDGDAEAESGETIQLAVNMKNWLDATSALTVTLVPDAATAPYVTMIVDTYSPGAIASLGTTNQNFSFSISPTAPPDLEMNFKVVYADGTYSDFEYLTYTANPNYVNITNNLLDITVSGKGNLGHNDFPYNAKGIGVSYNGTNGTLYEGSFLIGNSGTSLSDNARLSTGYPSTDWVAGTRIAVNPAPASSDHETQAVFSDTGNPAPLGLQVTQKTYNFNNANDDDYLIVEYIITNTSGVNRMGLYTGLFMDWDIQSNNLDPFAYAKNVCSYDVSKKMIYAHENGYNDYYAVALLSEQAFTSKAYVGGTATFTDAQKFIDISNAPTPATATISTPNDIYQYIGAGSFDLLAGQTKRVIFAIIGGNSLAALDASRLSAINNYYGQIFGKVPVNAVSATQATGDTEMKDAEGWTHYYKAGSPNTLLLSVKKDNAVDIVPNQVMAGYGGNPYYTQITAPYVVNPAGWFVMNRYWEVNPTIQPSAPIEVKMYYSQADFNALQIPCANLITHNQMEFFKFKTGSGIDPNPANGHSGATLADLLMLPATLGTVGTTGDNFYASFQVAGFSGGGGGGTGDASSLPVELQYFDANLLHSHIVKLQWATLTELQSDKFIVERSADGISTEIVTTVAAAGNSTEIKKYETFDYKPVVRKAYYRLKMVDIDGSYTYSHWAEINANFSGITLAPNPSAGQFSLFTISNQSVETAHIEVFNEVGQKIFTKDISGEKVNIDLSAMPDGVYLIKYISEARTIPLKWVKNSQ